METEIITGGMSEKRFDVATTEDIRATFISHRKELTWLAEFLTDNDEVAEACVIDASVIAAAQSVVFQAYLWRWTRLAIISSTVEIQESRITQLASFYERRSCVHREHPQLADDSIEFLVAKSDVFQSRLDVLCRFALIMRGVEKCSSSEAARLLRISRHAVESAYCAAIEWLEIIHCQMLIDCFVCGAT
jgi:DNA-directed RNA polymerase specialized sigma24 family protein